MVMKNKLVKHHVAKSTLIMRKLSLAFVSVSSVIAIIAIPTYINIKNQIKLNSDESALALAKESVEFTFLSELKSVVNN